jgi:translation initiation factor IF-2
VRVHELAKELGVTSKELLEALKEMGADGLTASSSVPDQAVPRLRASGGKAVPEAKMKEAVEEPTPKARPRKKAAVKADASAPGPPGEASTASSVLPGAVGVDEPPAAPAAPAPGPTCGL